MLSGHVSQKGLAASCCALAVAAGMLFFFPPTSARGESSEKDKAALEAVMAEAKKAVDEKLAKDPALKALAGKYPVVLLHSRQYADGAYLQSAYSFIYETADESKHRNDVQLLFGNGGFPLSFDINMVTNQSNLVADLGDVDFTKDPDPKAVDINGEGQHTWLPDQVLAVEGDAYLERVRDDRGNLFYVVFKVIAVDKDARYMAFIWRKLLGGKTVKAKEDPEPPAKDK